jgi:hypothetical protein
VRPELKENETRTWKLMQKNAGICLTSSLQGMYVCMSTTSNILMICINNENVDCLDLDKVVDEFLSRKKRRICQ